MMLNKLQFAGLLLATAVGIQQFALAEEPADTTTQSSYTVFKSHSITEDEVGAIVQAWQRASGNAKVNPQVSDSGTAALRDILAGMTVHIAPDPDEILGLLSEFCLANQVPLATTDGVGISRWMAFCVYDWLQRSSITGDKKNSLRQAYHEYHLGLATRIVETVILAQDPSHREDMRTIMRFAAADVASKLDDRVFQLINMPLYPAYKDPLSPQQQDIVTAQVLDIRPPFYGIPSHMMLTPEESFNNDLHEYLSTIVYSTIERESLRQVAPGILATRCWGRVLYSAESQAGSWPMLVTIRTVPSQH